MSYTAALVQHSIYTAALVQRSIYTATLAEVPSLMSNYLINRYDLTGLYGGTAVKLDGLSAATLAALSNGARIQIGFTDRRVAQYVLRVKVGGEVDTVDSGRLVVCDNASTRVWELEYVFKDALPAVWDETQLLWCPVTGYGGAASLLDGFTLPA